MITKSRPLHEVVDLRLIPGRTRLVSGGLLRDPPEDRGLLPAGDSLPDRRLDPLRVGGRRQRLSQLLELLLNLQ